MKIISVHSLQCIQCRQNIKDVSILEASKQSVSESLAMKLLGAKASIIREIDLFIYNNYLLDSN